MHNIAANVAPSCSRVNLVMKPMIVPPATRVEILIDCRGNARELTEQNVRALEKRVGQILFTRHVESTCCAFGVVKAVVRVVCGHGRPPALDPTYG